MTNLKKLTVAMAVVVTVCAYLPQDANADGPLRRWWRNITGRTSTTANSNCCGTQQTALSPTVAANPHNLQPGQCMRTCQQTCSRTVVNYVPQTAYRTAYKRVPVTQYRPVTNSDPCTGCTVTCMKPCTSYTYQVQRVPYTTYRPVYRTQTYKVPVTTIPTIVRRALVALAQLAAAVLLPTSLHQHQLVAALVASATLERLITLVH